MCILSLKRKLLDINRYVATAFHPNEREILSSPFFISAVYFTVFDFIVIDRLSLFPEAGTGTTDKEKREKPCEREESEVLTSSGSIAALHKYAENGHKGAHNENGCYRIPRWIVKRRTKKKDICERHVDQLLIRGEQVVTVMLEQSQT